MIRVSVFRKLSLGANENAKNDREWRRVTYGRHSHRVFRTEPDGRVYILVDSFGDALFNVLNVVAVKSDATIWFNDPDCGASPKYAGNLDLDECHVYRFGPESGRAVQMTIEFVMPKGLAFSPDESLLYIIKAHSKQFENGLSQIR